MSFAIITENDISDWKDQTGKEYHFPNRYRPILQPGTNVIYYKGRMKDNKYQKLRLSTAPHYFGFGKIAAIKPDPASGKQDFFATIINYKEFTQAVPFKIKDNYLEEIPDAKKNNWWRNGVRVATEEIFNRILDVNFSGIIRYSGNFNDNESSDEALTTESFDGEKKVVYTFKYERDRRLRDAAIKIHGTTCLGCGMNFKTKYGKWGEGFIHVHHKKPVSTGKQKVSAARDLVVVCPNCHWMIHRVKKQVLTIDELRNLIAENSDAL